ncbi:cobalamin-5-phosphate synthase family protein [Xanthomonas citri pv. punicae str. LMG 859]|nr:cobalamin-5-phosphate synthase family protein [Xanthomonas citri pv. punicae str. LMG 859]
MIDGLLAAIGFLTRIPVPARVFTRAGAQARSLCWYPLVGVLLGGVVCGLAWCLREVAPLLGAALLLSAWVWLTGALHLDGLADTTDAWVGGTGERARTLAIMKDPTSGPMAVTAVVLVLLLKCAALASLLAQAPTTLWLAPLLAQRASCRVSEHLVCARCRAGQRAVGRPTGRPVAGAERRHRGVQRCRAGDRGVVRRHRRTGVRTLAPRLPAAPGRHDRRYLRRIGRTDRNGRAGDAGAVVGLTRQALQLTQSSSRLMTPARASSVPA